MRVFFRDFLIAFAAVALPMVLAGLAIGLVPWIGTPVVAPVHIVYLVPIGLLAFGARHLRYGTVAGVVTFAAAAYGWIGGGLLWQITTLHEMELHASTPPARGSGLLALPDAESCDALCVQVLASRKFNIAIPRDGDWAIWSVVQGEACYDEALSRSRSLFVRAGFRNMCMQHHMVEDIGNALILAEQKMPHGKPADGAADEPVSDAPVTEVAGEIPGFVGTMLELRLRKSGAEQLVARRFIGQVESAAEGLTFTIAPGPFRVGKEADRIAFYAAATGLSFKAETEQADALAALSKAELALMKSDLVTDVKSGDNRLALASDFGRAAGRLAKANLAQAREHSVRMLDSGSPVLTHAGLIAVLSEPKPDLPFAREKLAALLRSDNPAIVGIALRRTYYAFELANDPALKPLILEIAFRTDLFRSDTMLNSEGSAGYAELARYGAFDEDLRQRAKAFLRTESDVSKAQCRVLFRIIGVGGKAHHIEAIDTFLELPRQAFATCIYQLTALRVDRDYSERKTRLTQQQMKILTARAKELSILPLAELWHGVSWVDDDRERAGPDFIDLVSARRHDADQDPGALTRKEAATLERLEKDFSR